MPYKPRRRLFLSDEDQSLSEHAREVCLRSTADQRAAAHRYVQMYGPQPPTPIEAVCRYQAAMMYFAAGSTGGNESDLLETARTLELLHERYEAAIEANR
jgi:hypothetical protein